MTQFEFLLSTPAQSSLRNAHPVGHTTDTPYDCSNRVIMALPAMLCYISYIIKCTTYHVYFTVRNEGGAFQDEIITLRMHSGQFET
jgi:hypothetical protein